MGGMTIPKEVREALRALAREHGPLLVTAAVGEWVRELAIEGMKARIVARSEADTECPRCRARDAMHKEMMAAARRSQNGRPLGAPPVAANDE